MPRKLSATSRDLCGVAAVAVAIGLFNVGDPARLARPTPQAAAVGSWYVGGVEAQAGQLGRVAGGTAATPGPAALPPPDLTPMAWFVPGGRNHGTEDLAMNLARIALHANEPLYLSDTWGRTSGPATSDHHVSNTDAWAVDLAVLGIQEPTPQAEEAARRIAAALGHPGYTGGDLTVTIQGYRFQLLWKVGGHFNHVHLGVKHLAAAPGA